MADRISLGMRLVRKSGVRFITSICNLEACELRTCFDWVVVLSFGLSLSLAVFCFVFVAF